MSSRGNPFEITKAVDLTDEEIASMFVDLPLSHGGFDTIADPRSPMPHFLVGGKGGGRTHLMRHLSYEVQTLAVARRYELVAKEGYIGVYLRCSGLNSNRFHGKGKPEETWDAVFAYYMDLWMAHALISILESIGKGTDCPWSSTTLAEFCSDAAALFDDSTDLAPIDSLGDLRGLLELILRDIDRVVNNAVFAPTLELVIRSAPGRLPFGISELISSRYALVPMARITFLLDEFENLDEPQQRYVQTLVREKTLSAGFIIGSRRSGLRTFRTLSAGEENKQGSEYELTVLEEVYAGNKRAFRDFCRKVALSRLRQSRQDADVQTLKLMFGVEPSTGGNWALRGLEDLRAKPSDQRPHMRRFREVVHQATGSSSVTGSIATALEVPDNPVLEKLAILRFYYDWSPGGPPSLETAEGARKLISSYFSESLDASDKRFCKHHRNDMIAQLYNENSQRQAYFGLDGFIAMSGYLPRNLLVVLKNVVRWAEFLGEDPIHGSAPVSLRAQIEGVLEASQWFLRDSLPEGRMQRECELAIRRLGGYLRRMRMSDKPVEVECGSFSTDLAGVTNSAIETLEACARHNLLVHIASGQIDRNSGTTHYKYQINPMLTPLFDLPTSRRGVVKLSAAEINAVFDSSVSDEQFNHLARTRLRRFSAPFSELVVLKEQGELF